MFRSIHFNGQRICESSQHTQQFCFQRVSGNHLESWSETRKKRDTKRRKEDESIYEVTTSADKTESEHDDVYEVIKTNDTEYIDNEDDRVVIEHDTASVKTSVKNENKSLTTSMEKISGDIQSEYSETNIT